MRERERERERERMGQSNVQIWERQIRDEELSDLGIFFNSNRELVFFFPVLCRVGWFFKKLSIFTIFFFKYDMEAIWLLMHKTLRATLEDKIDSAQSAQISYYFSH